MIIWISSKRKSSLLQEKVDNLGESGYGFAKSAGEEAKTQKANLQQGLIRKQFELDDIEGQLDDIASHLDQARQQNEEWIVNKHVLKPRRKRSASAYAIYKVS